ncbi:LTA synthase family protein [Agathobaculum sp. NTUH-O15-33]|uniref:LTA synthase family protein n=1 Tax=Agathobaculum sp. NTUH-O15-33 TaxID=3079302 RepID=UPI002958D6E5|nr:LTA synthase family protein [Agathobaculum sp. NTUH-O15-33]WNX85180.1 LTA synthase family protein [Agathobaculum sp. NTUH-O15-33]
MTDKKQGKTGGAIKPLWLAASFFLMAVWCEAAFRLTLGAWGSAGTLLAVLFAPALALAISGAAALLPARGARMLTVAAAAGLWFFYISQAVYFRVFQTCYPLYSLLNGGQVLGFWRQILHAFAERWWQTLLISLPLIVLLCLLQNRAFSARSPRMGVALLFGAFLWHSLALSAVPAFGTGAATPYDAYYNGGSMRAGAEKLGLWNAFRLDAERTLFGFPRGTSLLDAIPEEETEQPRPEEQPRTAYGDNVLPIDFAALNETETDPGVRELNGFFASREPTRQNEMTGVYEGYNLIFLTAEGFSPYAVDQNLTPTLYKMVHQGVTFTNFYNPIWGVSTIDGEYVNCLGLVPKAGVWSLYQSRENALPFALGNQFRALGYQTNAYHNHTFDYYRREVSHPNLGYTYKGLGSGVRVTEEWPESDLEMMQTTLPEYLRNAPFHIYYMTVSGHMEYNFYGNVQAAKHRDKVQGLPYSDACKAYVACHIELDRAMEYLLEQLEAAGIADKTVIAMAPDHYPYGLTNEQISEFLGHAVDPTFELYKSTFILYQPGMEPRTVDKLCWSADILPTLSNLFGLPYDSRLLTGRDIFSDAPPFLLFEDRSFMTDRVRFNASTGEAQWAEGQTPDEAYLERMKQAVSAEFTAAARIIETDYYRHVLPNGAQSASQMK